jgi:hypothetical protein
VWLHSASSGGARSAVIVISTECIDTHRWCPFTARRIMVSGIGTLGLESCNEALELSHGNERFDSLVTVSEEANVTGLLLC